MELDLTAKFKGGTRVKRPSKSLKISAGPDPAAMRWHLAIEFSQWPTLDNKALILPRSVLSTTTEMATVY